MGAPSAILEDAQLLDRNDHRFSPKDDRSRGPRLLSLVWTQAAQDDGSGPPLVAAAQLVPGGPAVYLGSGLLLTAAHVVNPGADISVVIARVKLPAKVLKRGAYEEIDLSLQHFDLRSPASGIASASYGATEGSARFPKIFNYINRKQPFDSRRWRDIGY